MIGHGLSRQAWQVVGGAGQDVVCLGRRGVDGTVRRDKVRRDTTRQGRRGAMRRNKS
jgi:hypothetical protein